MSNINGDGRVPQWKQLCEEAMLELDPATLLQRIAEAHSAILDRIKDRLTKPSDSEQLALQDALESLRVLREVAESELMDGLAKTGT
jgi:hypothetical protein